jgi:hypothetical protein
MTVPQEFLDQLQRSLCRPQPVYINEQEFAKDEHSLVSG